MLSWDGVEAARHKSKKKAKKTVVIGYRDKRVRLRGLGPVDGTKKERLAKIE